jgi:hypothetical protein
MSLNDFLDVFIIHFSTLSERRMQILKAIPENISACWITENSITTSEFNYVDSESVFGVSMRKIGMDLGINSRSLSRSRQRAKWEGYSLYLRSYLDLRGENLVASQINQRVRQKQPILENLKQHIVAIQLAETSSKPFQLILEDDAIPHQSSWNKLEQLLKVRLSNDRFVAFLGSGAGLVRTSSDQIIDNFGLYNTRTFCSRTAVATLYSQDVLKQVNKLIQDYGVPDWMPIDFLLQVAMRRLKIKTFWQDPPFFEQGSESGIFKSSLR